MSVLIMNQNKIETVIYMEIEYTVGDWCRTKKYHNYFQIESFEKDKDGWIIVNGKNCLIGSSIENIEKTNNQIEYDNLISELFHPNQIVLNISKIKIRQTPHSPDIFISEIIKGINIEDYGYGKSAVLQTLRRLKYEKFKV